MLKIQAGVSLIESMIALLIISIGLLGIAALQITAMKQNTTALNHSQAVWMGANMADRVRANIGQFANYSGVDTNESDPQDCLAGPCSTSQMIDSDAADWKIQVENLPSGRGMIVGNALVNPTQLNITVMWDDEGTGAIGTNCSNNPDNDLTCYTVTLVL